MKGWDKWVAKSARVKMDNCNIYAPPTQGCKIGQGSQNHLKNPIKPNDF